MIVYLQIKVKIIIILYMNNVKKRKYHEKNVLCNFLAGIIFFSSF